MSRNRGDSWKEYSPLKSKWKPILTLTDKDSTSQKMIIAIVTEQHKNAVLHLNFEALHTRKCSITRNIEDSPDFEPFKLRGLNSSCLLGREVTYYRRKNNMECYIGEPFKTIPVNINPCLCKEQDFECDPEFEWMNSKCTGEPIQPIDCKPGTSYLGKSGYVKIRGDLCEKGLELDRPVQRNCKVLTPAPKQPTDDGPGGFEPIIKTKEIPNQLIGKILQLKNITKTIVWTPTFLFHSDSEGSDWKLVDFKDKWVNGIYSEDHLLFFFMNDDSIYYSQNGLTSDPQPINSPKGLKINDLNVPPLAVSVTSPDKILFVASERGCPNAAQCYTKLYYTEDGSLSWSFVDSHVKKCLFLRTQEFSTASDDVFICLSFKFHDTSVPQNLIDPSQNPIQLIIYNDAGKQRDVLIEEGVVDFVLVQNYICAIVVSIFRVILIESQMAEIGN
jgi:hypothetical protein